MSLAADMDTAPCACFLFLSSQGDRLGRCSLSHNLRALLYKDVNGLTCVLCSDSHTFSDSECRRSDHLECALESVAFAFFKGQVLGHTASDGKVLGITALLVIIVVVVVIISAGSLSVVVSLHRIRLFTSSEASHRGNQHCRYDKSDLFHL